MMMHLGDRSGPSPGVVPAQGWRPHNATLHAAHHTSLALRLTLIYHFQQQVLEVPKDASASQLRKAYYKRCLLYHPDKLSSNLSDEDKVRVGLRMD